MSIPALDLQALDTQTLTRACEDWGVFYLVGHDLSTALRNRTAAVVEEFFSAPKAHKHSILRTDTNCWGYFDQELTKNQQDWKEIFDIGPAQPDGPLAGAIPQWPDNAGFRECISELNDILHATAIEVVSAITRQLSDTPTATALVQDAFEQHSSFLRINWYPPCPTPYTSPKQADTTLSASGGDLGIHHHTDAGAVTVLMQDEVPGLQVYNQGAWHSVAADTDALVINIGDIVQVWSNDRFVAPLHRVLANANQTRISIPYFLNPDYSYDYHPLTQEQPLYNAINWGTFRAGRSAGDYADQGEEIQISHFRR